MTTNGTNGVATNGISPSIATPPRHAYARAILGKELFDKLASSKILVVGAGGIGCELLKNLVLVGFGHVDIVDLDTIDLSNLNRQFLFQKAHIGKPKSLVAASTAKQFNPLASISPHHDNIKDTQKFGWDFFEQFDVVCNALDNADARRWVNRMCIMTGIPLVESGTTGFLGQTQPIMRGVSECYDCTDKVAPRSYPVCTIRSTPSTPIHCIVWAKTWLFPQLFGAEDENEDVELDKALQDGENVDQIANLRKEATEMRRMREEVLAVNASTEAERLQEVSRLVFNKVFKTDVERLLSMEDMWRSRTKPIPLEYDSAVQQSNGHAAEGSNLLRDQRNLSLRETVDQFVESLASLAKRGGASASDSLTFDKDDADAMDFVTATANLRSRVYHITPQTRFQVKQMAGNIIPAIASTNAIVAGAQVLQTLHALRRAWRSARFIMLNPVNSGQYVSATPLEAPKPGCGVCQDDFVRARLNVEKATLNDVREAVLAARDEGGLAYDVEGLEMYEGARLLADEDFDDNLSRTLVSLGITSGKTITCADEDGKRAVLNVYVAEAAAGATRVVDFGESGRLPHLRDKPTPKRARPDSDDDEDVVEAVEAPFATAGPAKRKRPVPDDDEAVQAKVVESAKRARVAAATGTAEADAIELD